MNGTPIEVAVILYVVVLPIFLVLLAIGWIVQEREKEKRQKEEDEIRELIILEYNKKHHANGYNRK